MFIAEAKMPIYSVPFPSELAYTNQEHTCEKIFLLKCTHGQSHKWKYEKKKQCERNLHNTSSPQMALRNSDISGGTTF